MDNEMPDLSPQSFKIKLKFLSVVVIHLELKQRPGLSTAQRALGSSAVHPVGKAAASECCWEHAVEFSPSIEGEGHQEGIFIMAVLQGSAGLASNCTVACPASQRYQSSGGSELALAERHSLPVGSQGMRY
jgi:hypothetical protein